MRPSASAIAGNGENPVPASQAIQIMELIELGIESAKKHAPDAVPGIIFVSRSALSPADQQGAQSALLFYGLCRHALAQRGFLRLG